jgi:hypothetical protein
MKMSGYNVQCLTGHAYELPEGHPLVAKCIERGKKGFLDALCLSEEECVHCVEDRREHLRSKMRLCCDFGCPMGEDDCKNGCMVALDLQELEERVKKTTLA